MKLLLLLLIVSWSAVIATAQFQERIHRLLSKACECHGIAGLAAAIVQGNETLFSEVYGYSTLQPNVPMTKNDTWLLLASLSKAMASTVISLRTLESKYNYDVNRPIRSYVPDIKLMDEIRTKYATMNDLLAHRVGVPRYDMLWLSYHKKNALKWVKELDFVSQFRSSFKYTNVMYNLAGDILSHLSGQTWSQLVHTHLFRPLGMNAARLVGDADLNHSKLVRSYFNLSTGLSPVSQAIQLASAYAQPAAGVALPLTDMELWMKALTASGYLLDKSFKTEADPLHAAIIATAKATNAYSTKLKNDMVLNMEFINASLYAPQMSASYGRGWLRSYYRGRMSLVHKGTIFGVDSYLSWFPRQNVSVFVIANFIISRHNLFYASLPQWLNQYLSDVLFGNAPWIDESNICDFLTPRRKASSNKTKPLHKLQIRLRTLTAEERRILPGLYHNRLFGPLRLALNRTSRRLEVRFGKLGRLQLIPVQIGNRSDDPMAPIQMITKVMGPLWFYSSHLMNLKLENVSQSENSGRYLPLGAYKTRATFTRCPERRGTIKWMILNVLEPSVSPEFTRVGAIEDGDEYSCRGCRPRNPMEELFILILIFSVWRRFGN